MHNFPRRSMHGVLLSFVTGVLIFFIAHLHIPSNNALKQDLVQKSYHFFGNGSRPNKNSSGFNLLLQPTHKLILQCIVVIRYFTDFTHILQGYFTGTGARFAPVPMKQPWRIWVNE